ncbi:hypothetical protein FA95DRAFT_1682955 [Auriscalpium vulgare]|uniref:Uncharacterized protein n=1 Tax=Auriscalpium vulgare TaxID=40419 RepID=A0ACB8RCQ4_9AGAM|nr:hypothetical protein FA95DRAFT_1682955 [Auriscalpium vulgare]
MLHCDTVGWLTALQTQKLDTVLIIMSPYHYSHDDSDASSYHSSNWGRVEKYHRGVEIPPWNDEERSKEASYRYKQIDEPTPHRMILPPVYEGPYGDEHAKGSDWPVVWQHGHPISKSGHSDSVSQYTSRSGESCSGDLKHTDDGNCPTCLPRYRREHKSKRSSRSHHERRHSSAADDLYLPDGPYFPQPQYDGTSTCMTSIGMNVPGGKMNMTSMHAENANGHTTQTRTWFEPDHHRPSVHGGHPVHGAPLPSSLSIPVHYYPVKVVPSHTPTPRYYLAGPYHE